MCFSIHIDFLSTTHFIYVKLLLQFFKHKSSHHSTFTVIYYSIWHNLPEKALNYFDGSREVDTHTTVINKTNVFLNMVILYILLLSWNLNERISIEYYTVIYTIAKS